MLQTTENSNLWDLKVDLSTSLDILIESGLGRSLRIKKREIFTFLMSLGFVPQNCHSHFPFSHGSIFPHTALQNHEVFSDPPYSDIVLGNKFIHKKNHSLPLIGS
jgi:hypothetical protein